ncbi:CPBP family glutamic-type intramembrane protease [Clostridium folliculivorans]|uniref:CAAX prenyl protease 2/Lysostaphin resistance protein A-like domain-containing protein n=1 Tax=Clostridium folliculivorans TaxID=2886038 RepID=A0A9W5Y280_9CLOT|nr:CPBP family glutamic-type intramembrane protease [Clostridium folliculivorans]GKU25223.1 hypothetical protein CFOLD11_20490 [Clostridium folliculivorans]GKU31321.1 hypothetical protein CFB3_34280 [Clostridium folliculivorans]
MRTICKRINNYLKRLSTFKFTVAMVLATYLVQLPFIPLYNLYEKYIGPMGGSSSLKASSLVTQIIFASIIAPLFETLISQCAVIEILNCIEIFKEKKIIIAIISAFLFAIGHTYSFLYVFYTFIIGLILAYSYLTYKEKSYSAFWVVFWIHCIRNTISTILFTLNLF